MKRLSGVIGICGAALLWFCGSGCDTPTAQRLRRENERLNEVNKEQLKQIVDLRDSLGLKDRDIQLAVVERQGAERQVDLLKRRLQELENRPQTQTQTRLQFTPEERRRLLAIAQKFEGTVEGNRIRLPSDFFFASGSWVLRDDAKRVLREMSEVLVPEKYGLLVVGNTDSEPIKKLKSKGIDSNRQLSLMRALSVVEYLEKECRYPRTLLLPAGWGEIFPVETNATPVGRAKNRRVDIYIDADISNLQAISAITGVSEAGIPMEGELEDEGSAVIQPLVAPRVLQGGAPAGGGGAAPFEK
ncbi:MAG: OmpA family protein [Planctomycetota bacterium]